MARREVWWETCESARCIGIRLDGSVGCLAHASGDSIEAALSKLSDDGWLDARGVTFTGDLLELVLAVVPRDDEGNRRLANANFARATFQSDARFDSTVFEGFARFDRATFMADAGFERATFNRLARFDRAAFLGVATFAGVAFKGLARFNRARFGGAAAFAQTTFNGDTWFDATTFGRDATFTRSTFNGDTWFNEATFAGPASFSDVSFGGNTRFNDTSLASDTSFDRTTFAGETSFDRATFDEDAHFSGSTFQHVARFEDAVFASNARFHKAAFTSDVWFSRTTFIRNAWLAETIFIHNAEFRDATFASEASFNDANFKGPARFEGVTVASEARFSGATFNSVARFGDAIFRGDVSFSGTIFSGRTFFEGTTFDGLARFTATDFGHYARFTDTTFRDVRFTRTAFRGDASFDRSLVHQDAEFRGASFESARQFGPVVVEGTLDLDGTVFRERVQIDVTATTLSCRRARFLAGVHLRARQADVLLDDADLASPSILSAIPASELDEWDRQRLRPAGDVEEDDERASMPAQRDDRILPLEIGGDQDLPVGQDHGQTRRPRLLSVQRADVAGLTVAGMDLRACRFAGAHHLDRLRTDECTFGTTPPAWWRTTRQTIADEHRWRIEHEAGCASPATTVSASIPTNTGGRHDPAHRPPPSGVTAPPAAPTATQVASIYRDLRKGREDSKDEPGAADFYYGEMEMRRQATRRRHRRDRRLSASDVGEHAILTLYWLVSGYGLRAWRALATLVVLVLVGGVVFAEWGLEAPYEAGTGQPRQPRPSGLDGLPTGVRTSAHAAAALLRDTDAALTPAGEWLHLALRLLGPVLFGLAVLSVRGRVRR